MQRQDQARGGKSVLKGRTAADRGRPAVSHKPEQAPRVLWIRKRRLPVDDPQATKERVDLQRVGADRGPSAAVPCRLNLGGLVLQATADRGAPARPARPARPAGERRAALLLNLSQIFF